MIGATGALFLLLAGGFGTFGGSRGGGSASANSALPGTVAWYGDSLTEGACSGTPPPASLDAQLAAAGKPGYFVANRGISAETAHQIATRVLAGSATACVGEPCGTYVLEGGVNTLKHGTMDATPTATVVSVTLNGDGGADGQHDLGMLDAADHLHATHSSSRVLLIGVLPYAGCTICGNNPSPGERATAYNAALLSACASRTWLTCLVPYAAFESPTTPHYLRADYACTNGDGIHLVDAGSSALATAVLSAVSW